MPQSTDLADARKVFRMGVLAAVMEMALGVGWVVFPFAGRGSFHVVGGIVIVAGGVIVLGVALRFRSRSRSRNR
jgi:hypothetical protein